MELIHAFLEMLAHLPEHLTELARNHGPWIYALLFAVIFCETGLVITPFLPGDSLLFAVGALAGQGVLDVWIGAGVLLAGAIAGDTANYWIGRWAGRQLTARFPRLIRREHLDRTHAFFERHGAKTIVLARFVPIVRTFAPFVAGMGTMSYSRFMTYNVGGAVLWVGLLVPAGYWFGSIPVVRENFELVILGIIALSVLPMLVEAWRARTSASRV
jgi:membrane-associated protein